MPFPGDLEQSLGPNYVFERELGGGGMSRVFLAEERALGRKVVVKVLPDDIAGQVSVERFRREIALAAQLSHPHIVPLLAAGEAAGLPYFTMPYVSGESLRARLAKERELPIGEAVRILREVASALAFAHQHGVVHRDIKPDNVLLAGGAAMVTDFGVAKAVSASTGGDSGLTSLGVALGTPAYMAPEQATADPLTDHRADLYAWGVLAYEMLTGGTPFAGRPPQAMLAAHVTETPESTSKRRASVPAALDQIVMRCLAKRPADRPQGAHELVHALDDLATPTAGLPPAVVAPARGEVRRRFIPVGAIAALLLVLATGGWWAWRAKVGPDVDPRMVAVVPFDNLTGDPSLEHVGRIAADWVMQGIAQTDSANVVSSNAVAFAIGDGQGATTDIVGRLAAVTRAATVITGTVTKFGDSLRVQASIVDSRSRKLIRAIPPVSGPVSDPLVAITALREHLLGAIVTGDIARRVTIGTTPPNYSAYNEFMAGLAVFPKNQIDSRPYMRRAIALDSTFAGPYSVLAASFVNVGQRDSAQEVVAHLDALRDRLSGTDRLMLDYDHAMINGDRAAELRIAGQLLERTSDPMFAYLQGLSANGLLRPRDAIPALKRSDSAMTAMGWGPQLTQMAEAHHQVGDHQQEMAVLQRGRGLYQNNVAFVNQMLRALAGMRDGARALALADTILRSEATARGSGRLNAVINGITELRAHGDTATADAMLKLAVEWCASHRLDPPDPVRDAAEGRVLLLLGQPDSAAILFRRASRDTASLTPPGYLGVIAARAGDRTRALAIADSLGSLQRRWLLGGNVYWRASILAALGERDQAVQLLRTAHQQGQGMGGWHHAEPLAALRGYPPFEALITPQK